jgi:4-hydroxythreonine-4-phosphate dehydrogenase
VEEKKKPVIGITLGDINGIGPQIILKALSNERIFNKCQVVIFGSESVLQFYKKQFPAIKTPFHVLAKDEKFHSKMANLVECSDKPLIVNMGVSSDFSGSMSVRFLNEALQYYQDGKIDALVTGPVNKAFIKTNPPFTGHTEFIAQKLNEKDPMMIMTSDYIRVALASHHLALKEVSGKLNAAVLLQKIKTLNESLSIDFGAQRPKIAVLALNPHSGEGGKIGTEEQEIIIPALKKAEDQKIIVQGPFAADGFFASGKFQHFDGVLAMYHDQGLIPFKYIAGMEGVNFTANLKIVRTSPDHGVALDIVDKGEADANSMMHAIYQALDILQMRTKMKQYREKPLAKLEIKDLER